MNTLSRVAQQTAAPLGHHLQSMTVKDVEAVLSDYSEASIMFTPNGIVAGLEPLRGFSRPSFFASDPRVSAEL